MNIHYTTRGIYEIFENMIKIDVNKSDGCDNIGPYILKLSAPYIVSSFTYILTDDWHRYIANSAENAKVSPVFEAGQKLCLQIIDRNHFYPRCLN